MAVSVAWRTAKWLVRHADEIAPPAYFVVKSLLDNDIEVGEPGWHRIVCGFSRATPAALQDDKAQFKIDLLKISDGGSDNAWVAGDFTAINTALASFITVIKPKISAQHTYTGITAYRMRFNPDDPGPSAGPSNPPRPFRDSGPPVYIGAQTIVGTSAYQFPYQAAATITLKTGFPKHWGRIYIPGFSVSLDPFGRITSADQTVLANAAFDLHDDLNAAGFLWCVPMTQMHKAKFHGLLGVRDVVVDDIPDVIRRRRPKYPSRRVTGVE